MLLVRSAFRERDDVVDVELFAVSTTPATDLRLVTQPGAQLAGGHPALGAGAACMLAVLRQKASVLGLGFSPQP